MGQGICDRIKQATSPEKIEAALKDALKYEFISEKTKRRVIRLAEQQIKVLEGSKEKAE